MLDAGDRAAQTFAVEGGPERSMYIMRMAQQLECTAEHGRPCLVCPSCRQIAAGTSLDVVYMNKSGGSGRSSRQTYKVGDAQEFIERLGMGSYGRYLIGIIEDADSMSEVVQNKLLKTLEEPAPNTVLILGVTNRDNLLDTVRSRCSFIRLEGMAEDVRQDRTGASDHAAASDADNAADADKLRELSAMLIDRGCRYHQFREALDKSIKSREDALALIDVFQDDMVRLMSAQGSTSAVRRAAASCIELAAGAGMDMRREMIPGRALRRLFLEIRQ